MATIGRNAAMAELPSGPRFKGVLAWFMWLALYLVCIVGFRSRLAALLKLPPPAAPAQPVPDAGTTSAGRTARQRRPR